MATSYRAYWLTIAFVVVFSFALFAQTRQTVAVARDLSSTLGELSRVAPATIQDLDIASQQGGKLRWVTFWRGDKAPNAEVVEALRRNLEVAVPNLVHDAQASGGSVSTTFKLYKDLNAVCHALESLLPRGSESKPELAALNTDLADMNRLKEELSSYIERAAASYEGKHPTLFTSTTSGGRPVKRIVDDTVPDNPSPKKRRASN